MATLTVIVTACCACDRLKYTLEGLVEQSIEDFDVLIADFGCDGETKALINQYCSEYVGFGSFEAASRSVPEVRNEAAARADGELLVFLDGGDYLSPESAETFIKAADETKADIILPRLYISGENEPYYDSFSDILATVPNIDRLDTALLNTLDYDGRVYRKKFFDLYSLRFPSQPVFYNASFMLDCLFGCEAKVTGAAGAIYDRRRGVFSEGFSEENKPSEKTLDICMSVYERAFSCVKTVIEEETGGFDGDEYSVQDVLYIYFSVLTDRFYRYFWYLSDTALEILRNKFEEISRLMTSERRKKINLSFRDLRFPQMYVTRADAVRLPLFSLLIDIDNLSSLGEFFASLYTQKFPFFEVFIKESTAASEHCPPELKKAENVTVLPDSGFFSEARRRAKGAVINIKSPVPLDPRLLSELSLSHAPGAALQYLFASKRKKYSAKTYLKHKGLAMR